jgi:hypothetical protein
MCSDGVAATEECRVRSTHEGKVRCGQPTPFSANPNRARSFSGTRSRVGGGVLGDDLAHVGAVRQHREAAAASVVECLSDQLRGQTSSGERRVDLGMGEGDRGGRSAHSRRTRRAGCRRRSRSGSVPGCRVPRRSPGLLRVGCPLGLPAGPDPGSGRTGWRLTMESRFERVDGDRQPADRRELLGGPAGGWPPRSPGPGCGARARVVTGLGGMRAARSLAVNRVGVTPGRQHGQSSGGLAGRKGLSGVDMETVGAAVDLGDPDVEQLDQGCARARPPR